MAFANIIENNLINAFYSLRKKKYINIMVVFSLFLGLLFPIIVLCFGNAGLNYINATLVKDYERVATLKINDNLLSRNDILEVIDANQYIESISRCILLRKTVITGNKFIYATVRAVDLDYIEFNDIHITKGKWFDDDSRDAVCIIGQKYLMDNFTGKALGEKINLAGLDFNVIGITEDIEFSDNIIITMPFAENLNLINNSLMHYYVKVMPENDMSLKVNELKEYIINHFDFYPTTSVFQDEYKNEIKSTLGYTLALLALVAIVLFYSLLNTANIVRNKVIETKKNYGIRVALGATNKDIYFQNFFELLILLAISSVMVFASIYLISFYANNLTGFTIIKLNFIVVFITETTCVFIAFVMSHLTLRKVMKLNAIEILRG